MRVVLVLLLPPFSTDVNTLSSVESLTISGNGTIVSPGNVFELGFFRTPASSGDGDRWYIGIWYKLLPDRIYVWVANRDNPLSNNNGTLKIFNSNIVLLDDSDTPVWSTNLTGAARTLVTAELLANGNFVLRDSKTNGEDGILWQSFDSPTDTLLPGMKMGWDLKTGNNKFLTSWKSEFDPSSGNFLYKLEHRALSEFFLYSTGVAVQRSGPWVGTGFSGIPDMQQWNNVNIVYNFTESREEVAFTFGVTDNNIYSRLIMSSSGNLELSRLIPTAERWNVFWGSSNLRCDLNVFCGPYTNCDVNMSPMCRCMEGFKPSELEELAEGEEMSTGCVRKTPLSCDGNVFLWLRNMKLPDTTKAIVDRRIGLKECKEKCIKDCNCTAYANVDFRNNGSGCVIWLGELMDVRNFVVGGQDLYVKVATADLDNKSNRTGEVKDHKSNRTGKIIGLIVGTSVLLLLCFILFRICKRKRKPATEATTPNVSREIDRDTLMNQMEIPSDLNLSTENLTEDTEDLEPPSPEYERLVKATDNFSDSNKLGEGGFGCVYKGISVSGEEIAVKRLSELSHQGNDEFEVEIKVISKLQHKNLVRILGGCAYKHEKLLVYEHMENSSLDRHIFGRKPNYELNWQKRFDIINGITRGVVYLHHDSRIRVIHRDLKASNILLDKNMVPKISDFGMARLFSHDEHEAITRRIVGTYGYMSPEYAMDGLYSEKSDVFSFGVLLLEIVTGRRNSRIWDCDEDSNLLSYVWRNMEQGTELEVADPCILDLSSPSPTFQPDEFKRCLKIALLCVQEYANARPFMLSVASMLGDKAEEIPKAEAPGYCVGRNHDIDSTTTWNPWTFGYSSSGLKDKK